MEIALLRCFAFLADGEYPQVADLAPSHAESARSGQAAAAGRQAMISGLGNLLGAGAAFGATKLLDKGPE